MFSTYAKLPHADDLIEVIDADDLPFLLMPRTEVLAQSLSHRVVLVALRNHEGRILVTHRTGSTGNIASPTPEGVWGLSASARVRAGESRVDAALRVLRKDVGIANAALVPGAGKAPITPAQNPFDLLHVTLFIAETALSSPIIAESEKSDSAMFLDKDELQGMAKHFPEMLSDGLLWAVTAGALFTRKRNYVS